MDIFDLTGKVAIVTGGNGGLGLGIVQGIIEKHKGKIEVRSNVAPAGDIPRGTTFTVTLLVEGPEIAAGGVKKMR